MAEDSPGGRRQGRDDRMIPIAIVAIVMMIPLVAIVGGAAWFPWILGLVLLIGGGTLSARHLMDHRHELRMAELEARERLMREERSQLDIANRILEADERNARRQLGGAGTVES
ncbi:MAG: hypothetical protein AB1Z57_00625 [Acidimicrobiia bacterium]